MTWRKAAEHTLRRRLGQIHRTIEDRTGWLFGYTRFRGHTTAGYPTHAMWLAICPMRDGYAFSISVKDHLFYLGREPV